MKVTIRNTLLTVAMVTATTAAWAGEAGSLVTFTAGTAAKAAEVNGNFNALRTAVNGNATDIAALQATVDSQQATIAALSSSITALQGGVTALQAAAPTITYAVGSGAVPQNIDSTARFVGVTATVTVAAGETVVVTSHFVPGWVSSPAGQVSNFIFSTCLRSSGSVADPSGFGTFMTSAISDRNAIGVSTAHVFTSLNPGTYEVGMCGYGSSIITGTWASGGSRVVVQNFH